MHRVLQRPLLPHVLSVALLTICTLVAYANSFDAQFVYDDFQNFVDNPRVHWYELQPDAIRDGILGGPTRRPVAMFTFGLNFYFGKLDVTGYHGFNFAVHALNAIGVYALLFATLGLPGARRRDIPPPARATLIGCALLAALLFALHPLQTQSVTYVVQRMTAMATGFYLAAFLVYLHIVRGASGLRRWLGWCALGALYVLGLGSKEIAAPLPFALWLYEWCFGQRFDAAWARRNAAWLLPPLIALGAGFAALYDGLQDEYSRRDFTMTERLLTQLRVVFFYASLVLVPLPSRQNLLQLISTSHSLLDPITTALSLLGLLGLLGFAVWLAPRRPISAFGILWFFLHLVVESSVLPLEMIYEHRIYLPLVALSLIVADLLCIVPPARVRGAFTLTAAVAVVLAALTYQRNELWRDTADIWGDVYQKTGDIRALESVAWSVAGRGIQLAKQGRDRDALVYFRQAGQIAPDYARNYRSWGDSLVNLGRMEPAVTRYQKAIALEPEGWGAYDGLALALAQLDRMPLAAAAYREVVLRTDDIDTLMRAPRRLVERSYGLRAVMLLETGVAVKPASRELRSELVDLLIRAREFERVLPHALFMLEGDRDPRTHGQLALALWELGRTGPALEQLEAARALAPDDARHTANLAWMLATAPEPELRDPARALALVEPLIADAAEDVDLLDTASAALANLGRWDEAVLHIDRALELARSGEPSRTAELEQRRSDLQARRPVSHTIDPR